jgi:hypothetical protein
MAKTHAQRQKEYRERKKESLGKTWLASESKRTKKYYKKVSTLSTSEAKKRRKQLREKQASYRARKYLERGVNNEAQQGTTLNTAHNDIQTNEVSSTSTDSRLIVKLAYHKKQKKYNKKIQYLKQVSEVMKRKNENLRRQLNRMKLKIKKKGNIETKSPRTPKSRSESEMKKAGIEPDKHPNIRKKLMFANCIVGEMREKVMSRRSLDNTVIKKVVAGNIMRKYHLTQYTANLIGLRVRHKTNSGLERRNLAKQRYTKVTEFLEREDNSRLMPGKADAVKNGKEGRKQKFVLNDYLRNIYIKYRAEYQNEHISFATFCRARPKHIALVNFAARVTCLCTKHQNFALKLQCLKKYGLTKNTSPDSFSDTIETDEMHKKLQSVQQDNIHYKEWRRVKCDDGKQRMKLLDIEKDTKKFADDFMVEFQAFKEHAQRVKGQYQAFKHMKESLLENNDHVCLQMDFAENYNIKEMEEIQSAYWNQESVTLHPVVMYFQKDGSLMHRSMVVVSEVLNHNSSMVQSIIKKVIPWVKENSPNVNFIHYWTDSPTSQYRNKAIFDLVARHPNLYGIKASWHYFEAGHGKGACDGIGGAVKRSADTAMKIGKVNITCAKDFYEWGSKSDSKIAYKFVEKHEYEDSNKEHEELVKELNTIKGTLKLHVVVGLNANEIMVRETTCVCNKCFADTGFIFDKDNTCGWQKHFVRNVTHEEEVSEDQNAEIAVEDVTFPHIVKGDFVAAMYDGHAYVGKVIDIDEGMFEVSFMEKGSKVKDCLKWPKKEDTIWIEPKNLLCKIQEPKAQGKGMRSFKISDNDKALIAECKSK